MPFHNQSLPPQAMSSSGKLCMLRPTAQATWQGPCKTRQSQEGSVDVSPARLLGIFAQILIPEHCTRSSQILMLALALIQIGPRPDRNPCCHVKGSYLEAPRLCDKFEADLVVPVQLLAVPDQTTLSSPDPRYPHAGSQPCAGNIGESLGTYESSNSEEATWKHQALATPQG